MNFKKFILLILLFSYSLNVKGENNLLSNAKSGLLMEISSGRIIYEKDINKRVSVASMTKMMGMVLVMEALEDGKISLEEKIVVSKNASDMGGSQIWLSVGESISIEDLIKGVMMASANDGIVALAERIGGTEDNFVSMMNDKAKKMGLKNTNFVNPTGLDEDNHYSSAYDMALIAKELLNHENILNYTSIYEDYLRKGTKNEYWLVNTNKLIKTYNGADGLKTGYTDNAGYCMAVTAKRNGMRLLAIVLGEENGKIRNLETKELLDYGYNNYELDTIKKKGEILGTINIDKANKKDIEIISSRDITILKNKGEEKQNYKSDLRLNDLKLPIKKGEQIGKILILDDLGNQIKSEYVTVTSDIYKDNLLNIFFKIILSIINGNIF